MSETEVTTPKESGKLWGGRFSGATDPIMETFNASISYDKRMWLEDITGSIAYAKGIEKIGLITTAELMELEEGLQKVSQEWREGKFELKSTDEDIHTANERRLKELVGSVAGKLHTGRSRNDQVATDTRMWLRKEVSEINKHLTNLIEVFVNKAQSEINIILPGYTHMQQAQPIRWSQWLLSHVWALKKDADRLQELLPRVNCSPLGCGAIAGNPFGVDREFLAKEMSFTSVAENSLFGVSSRDFVAEFLFWCSLTSVHLSKWAEDLIIYNTKEFNFVRICDAYSTGSSLMPQKKNPDSLELIRAKCGRLFGNTAGFFMILKGLPSTYNKDLQEDKQALFDSVDSIKGMLQVARGTLHTLTVNSDACNAALSPDMLSTDVAYYLVRKGIPFREAHSLAGAVIRLAETKSIPLPDLTLQDIQSISKSFEADFNDIWNYSTSVDQYTSTGGTSKVAVTRQIQLLQNWISDYKM